MIPYVIAKGYHTAYVVTANISFAFTIYGMKCGLTWDVPVWIVDVCGCCRVGP